MATILKPRPEVEINNEIKTLLKLQPENFTVLHCQLLIEPNEMIRIWPQTYLIDEHLVKKSLLKAYNISLMPQWSLPNRKNGFAQFTLLFEGLNKNCRNFYMLEDITEPGAFYSNTLLRNFTDVYQVLIKIKF